MKKTTLLLGALLLIIASSQMYANNKKTLTNTSNKEFVKGDKKTVKLKITGMTCAGCSSHATQTLEEVEGVTSVHLEYPGDVATIEYDATKTNKEELITAIEKINYKAEEVKPKEKK